MGLFRLHLVFCANINWDEFLFLSQVHNYLRGDNLQIFQSFHVHFFQWLSIFNNEIDQIIAARFFMFLSGLGSACFIFKISRLYVSKVGSLFSTLCYFSYSNILIYGNSFRADSISIFLFLAAVYFIFKKSFVRFNTVFAGFLMALCFMITIKSVVYLLAVFCIYIINAAISRYKRREIKRAVLFFCTFSLFFALLYFFHNYALANVFVKSPDLEKASFAGWDHFAYFKSLFHKMFLENGFFPRREYFLATFEKNIIIWAVLTSGILSVLRDALKKKKEALKQLPLLGLVILPLTILVYRNAWAYYYVFIIPPVVVFCGIIMDKILSAYQKSQTKLKGLGLFFIIVLIIMSGCIQYSLSNSDEIKRQREIVSLVHKIFPVPTYYIDRCSMVSTYPKLGFFMSSWGMENYKKNGVLIFGDLIKDKQPLFLISNISSLNPDRVVRDEGRERELFVEDSMVLNENYIRHWGSLFVAGKKFNFLSDLQEKHFKILISGIYTVEAQDVVYIDGVEFLPGSYVDLISGGHIMSVESAPMKVNLRIGKDLYRPSEAPSSQFLFENFK